MINQVLGERGLGEWVRAEQAIPVSKKNLIGLSVMSRATLFHLFIDDALSGDIRGIGPT